METTETLDLQAQTLAGDIRDVLLTHIRSMETPWSKLSEQQQQDRIEACASGGRDLVRNAVRLVAHRGFAHMPITLKDWTVKDGIQLKVSALDTVEEITKLAEHKAGSAIIVFASSSAFLGARTEPTPEPDQPEIKFDPATGEIEPGADAGSEEAVEDSNALHTESLAEPPSLDAYVAGSNEETLRERSRRKGTRQPEHAGA